MAKPPCHSNCCQHVAVIAPDPRLPIDDGPSGDCKYGWTNIDKQNSLKDGEKLKIPKSYIYNIYIKSHCDHLPSLFKFEQNAPTSWNDLGPSIPQAPGPSPFPGPSRKRMVLYKGPSVMQWPRLRPVGYELGNWGLNMDKSFSSRNRKRKHMTKHCGHGTLSNGERTSRIHIFWPCFYVKQMSKTLDPNPSPEILILDNRKPSPGTKTARCKNQA